MTTDVDKNLPALPELTTRQIQFLKGLAHSLSPVVQIGKEGLSTGVLESIKQELLHHELIKIKIGNNSSLEKKETSEQVAGKSNAVLVQLIGKTIVLFKANPKSPKDKRIKLPTK